MKCYLCGEEQPDDGIALQKIADHFRVNHPDQFEDFERWPDGEIVLLDTTLEPDQFGGEA